MSTVLIVDDSPLVLASVRETFEAAGLDVVTTQNPMEVPRLIHRHGVRLALIDLHLPTVQGDVVARVVRRSFGRDVVLLLHTTAGLVEAEAAAKDCADGVVLKAEGGAYLLRLVQRWLERPVSSPSGFYSLKAAGER